MQMISNNVKMSQKSKQDKQILKKDSIEVSRKGRVIESDIKKVQEYNKGGWKKMVKEKISKNMERMSEEKKT